MGYTPFMLFLAPSSDSVHPTSLGMKGAPLECELLSNREEKQLPCERAGAIHRAGGEILRVKFGKGTFLMLACTEETSFSLCSPTVAGKNVFFLVFTVEVVFKVILLCSKTDV